MAVFSVTVAESFTLYIPGTLNASGTFGDNIFAGLSIAGSASINTNAYDYFTVGVTNPVAFSDSVTFTDAENVLYDAAGIIVEPIIFTDAQSTQVEFNPKNAESIIITNIQAGVRDTNSTTEESITFTNTQEGIRGQFGSVDDAITLTNTQAAIVAFFPQIAELLTLTEFISIQSNLVGYTAETIVFTDTQIQRGWIKIDDNQSANWANIGNNQTPSWVDVNSYQG
jgi:hypothetical protein